MNIKDFQVNPFTKFNDDWALLTVGNKDDFNSMTISWGGLGTLWSIPVAFIFVKPSRYTYQFVQKYDEITISFYDKQFKQALGIFGSKSGRDIDKVKATNFNPLVLDNGVTYQEAKETIICQKIFSQQLDKNNFPEVAKNFYQGQSESQPHFFIVAKVLDIK